MKKTSFILFVGMLLFCSAASAQFILGVEGSYLTSATGDQKNSNWGGGIQAKGKISNMVAIGGTLRTYFKNYHDYNTSSYSVQQADQTTQLAGLFEVYFGEKVQPFIGTDVGMYFTNTVVKSNASSTQSIDLKRNKTYFGVGPKAGFQVNTGSVSPFSQAQYHVLFGGGEDIEVPGFNDVVRTHDKFWTFDIGLLFQIGKVADKKSSE